MAASVSGGRSRHSSKTVRSQRSKAAVRQRTTASKSPEEAGAAKPDLDDLRRKRLLYLSVSPEARRRISVKAGDKPKAKEESADVRASSSGEHKRRKRRHRSSSSRSEKSSDVRRSRTEDYVYARAPSSTSDKRDRDTDKSSSEERRLRHSSSSRRHSLPTVTEVEVAPEDSVSQIGLRHDRKSSRTSSGSRSSLRRSSTTPVKLDTISEKDVESKSPSSSSKRSSKRDSTASLLGSLLRRNTAPAAPVAPRLVDCLTCGSDDVPHPQAAKLACGHRMCHDCLKRVFEMSVKDPAHMPPKCCSTDHIPLKHVEKLFDLKFKVLWNRKYQEYHTKNRIYCPAPKCGEWIKPSHVHSHQGRKYAQCPRCQTKVCTLCNGKMHKSRDCPKDPEIAKLVEQAKEKGWQTCHSCHAMVELKEGCNHMTCRCLAEFCMICGAKWKTCDCPWFNYRQLPDADRLNDWRVPEPIQVIYRRAFGAPDPAANGQGAQFIPFERVERTENRRQRTYLEELEHRRRQEREDADLARRMQLATLLDPQGEPQGHNRAEVEAWGLGNPAGHFLNDNFVQNAADVVMSAFGDARMGRRGERSSGRQRRARQAAQHDPGLVPNFLGDESVVGAGSANARARGIS